DKETLKDGITIRKWKKGDYFYPFGMRGQRKLLSKYFKDEKLDLNAKENQWLLCSNQDVVWVIGRRSDERFKVTQKTKKIIKISLLT
ncbi:MAG: tRNA lysidine(34) synthetase TilS, partial [Eudoraea sp.]|nr:tRNA lysidine(34) synthetase TilS [Eudoraea sp.]NNK30072.1 tRNA lysidine(34) synthetase TilS [Flavobacteriaceae bacterium]